MGTGTGVAPVALAQRQDPSPARRAVSRLPEFDSDGLCECCGRMPHACACGTPGNTVARARCTKCSKTYWIQETRSRRCQHCGHACVEVIPVYRVVLNGDVRDFDKQSLTYADVLKAVGYDPERVISVTYHAKVGRDAARSGILQFGRSVELADGMVINAMDTSNA